VGSTGALHGKQGRSYELKIIIQTTPSNTQYFNACEIIGKSNPKIGGGRTGRD
jgi:hypothetical protein